eukprot:gene41213-28448_t
MAGHASTDVGLRVDSSSSIASTAVLPPPRGVSPDDPLGPDMTRTPSVLAKALSL